MTVVNRSNDASELSIEDSRRSIAPAPLLVIAGLAIVLGVFFRFYHIDRKVYWGDEAYTSLRMLGETETRLVEDAAALHSIRDVASVLHPVVPGGTANMLMPVIGLALEEPHHPPLYYELGHLWVGAFGDSIVATRMLSAIISLFALPLAFWLGLELYRSRRAAWIAVAVFALSPVAMLYAQEAREYALWGVALLALNAALLRAVRRDRLLDWWLLALLTAGSLYVFPFTVFPLAGLAFWVLATQRSNPGLLLRCCFALAAGALAYLPWALILLHHAGAVIDQLATTLRSRSSVLAISRTFASSLRLTFFDTNAQQTSRVGVATTGAALLALAAAFALVMRRQRARVSLFLALPLLCSTLPLILLDLFSGGQVMRNPRYLTPAYLYLDFGLVGALWLLTRAAQARLRVAGYGLFVALLAAGAYSGFVSAQATTWWNKMEDNSIAVAAAINKAPRAVVVSDAYLGYALVLSNYVRPDVAVVLRPRCYECADRATPRLGADILPNGSFTDLYALGPSPSLQRLLRRLIARRHLTVTYHCINVRGNCASDLNVEPVFSVDTIR